MVLTGIADASRMYIQNTSILRINRYTCGANLRRILKVKRCKQVVKWVKVISRDPAVQ